VEFVHPVIVGKRALPARAVGGTDVIAELRSVVVPGDIVMAISDEETLGVEAVLRRAGAWGAESVWIGTGTAPPSGAADHVLWLPAASGATDRAAWAGGLVLVYHLLWELTHVCFEHPGLLKPEARPCSETECVTCSDDAQLGEVTDATGADIIRVRTAAGIIEVDASLVAPVAPGELVLVHAGVAIDRIEEATS
jgi:hypothetical protein